MHFLWNEETRKVRGESSVFAGKETARLLFPAEKILKAENKVTGEIFLEGRDFSHEKNSSLIKRLPGSSMRFLPEEELYPAPEKAILFPDPHANAIAGGEGGKYLLFNNCDFWAKQQFEMDYIASVKPVLPFPLYKEDKRLPRFRAKLSAKEVVKVTLMGDSISEGLNASGYHNFPPYQGAYFTLFARELAKFNRRSQFCNASVGGYGITHAVREEKVWRREDTDLFILAFGMNNFKNLTPEAFLEETRKVISLMRETSPGCEYILTASMPGNPQWLNTPFPVAKAYCEAFWKFREEAGEDLEIVDIFTPWDYIMSEKGYYSMTGNGVNHPNDYGYRLYASMFRGLFEDEFETL